LIQDTRDYEFNNGQYWLTTEKPQQRKPLTDEQRSDSEQLGEPVAWGMEGKDGFIFDVICPAEHDREEGGYTTPLYTTPQPASQRSEDTTQQKPWVGLTEQDRKNIHAMWVETDQLTDEQDVINIVENWLKEKNCDTW
jgi:hypothetical protein